MADIAFLHTSPVHVATFDALLASIAPGRTATHAVREDLLERARRDGVDDPSLDAAVRAALHAAAASGPRVVVCTCSTIGGLAEAASAAGPVPVTRIDRAMADEAVRRGAPVLVVAAVESTLAQTTGLLRSSAAASGQAVALRTLLVAEAWPHFEAGRMDDYAQAIADAVVADRRQGETVVLAQASMACATARLVDRDILPLTSPRLGVEHALRLCDRGREGTRTP